MSLITSFDIRALRALRSRNVGQPGDLVMRQSAGAFRHKTFILH